RKGEELVLATQLEQAYSKRQILGLYLSRIYFGSGAFGLEAASQRYFHTPASRLTLMEAAMLAAIPKSPTNYDPAEQPERSLERAGLVLSAMVETGVITPAQRAKALAHPPRVWREEESAGAQYFVDWVDGAVRRTVGPLKSDLVVETTLDAGAEAAAQKALDETAARFAGQRVEQGAVVALDGFGRVRAMTGGVDYGASQFNRAVSAHRQAGSAWKPFVYLAALEAGRTPDTLVVDEPVTIDGWSPRNFEPEYMGQVTLETALAHSINTVAARLADEVGRPAVAAAARRAGIVSAVNTEPAMALGSSLVTPLEMAQAYDAFANGGYRVSAYGIERIRTAAGHILYQHPAPALAPAIGNPALGELDGMLRKVVSAGTGVRAAIPGYDIAGKTGTASDFKDAWFCGFTGGLTAVVWMGRDDNTPMRGVTGGSAPAEAWRGFMRVAVKRLPHEAIPAGPPAPPPAAAIAAPPAAASGSAAPPTPAADPYANGPPPL
ncbi:MAG: transglycosylase domain-containing protein, partial [Caulobacteraceae bacterium]|nr:transglycosylase domain-containing protein [Caulobacteraceae bacterium]